jgi:hypothetical protein
MQLPPDLRDNSDEDGLIQGTSFAFKQVADLLIESTTRVHALQRGALKALSQQTVLTSLQSLSPRFRRFHGKDNKE